MTNHMVRTVNKLRFMEKLTEVYGLQYLVCAVKLLHYLIIIMIIIIIIIIIIIYIRVYSMQQSPSWEASQEFSKISWNLKVHYRIYNSQPPVRILSQLDPLHTPTTHFLKIRLQ